MVFNISNNIRLNLLIPFIGSLIVILLSSIWSLHLYNEGQHDNFADRVNKQLESSFSQAIDDEVNLIKGLLFFITNNEAIQASWRLKDREQLYHASSEIFDNISRLHNISHFYFHRSDGSSFLRVHAPERYDDTIKRSTLIRAIETKKAASGTEFGTFGRFVLRVVIPWKIDGQVVGYIELGERIEHILQRLSSNNHYDLILSLKKTYISDNNLEQTDFFIDNAAQLNRYKNIFILYKTIDEISPEVLQVVNATDINRGHIISQEGLSVMVSKVDVINFRNKPIASLDYILDVTGLVRQQNNLFSSLFYTVLITSLVLIIFYFYYSGRLQEQVNSNISKLKDEIAERRSVLIELSDNQQALKNIIEERDHSIEANKKRYQTLFDKTADALLIIEGNAFIDCNQAALDMLQYKTKEELYDTHPSELSPEFQPDGKSSAKKADLMIKQAFENGSHRFEWQHVRKNGEIFPVEVLLTAIPYEDTQLLHVVWRDISERIDAQVEIERQAYYDHLTDLPNRKLLLDRLTQALITSRRHHYYGAILFIDIDRFKSINDSLGHTAGDKLLIETSKRISSCLFDEDTVSRFGGDEFVVLLRHLGGNSESAGLAARKVASRIHEAFLRPFGIEDQELHVSTSIGISLFPMENENIEDIIKFADTAMYSAKENGRNQTAFYHSAMHDEVIKRLTLEKDFRNAVKAKQLELYYQPQLDDKGQVMSVEALLRWRHPELGYIQPETFISIAEDTGLIYEVGDFILHKSITDIKAINNDTGHQILLSINISPHQFRKLEFVQIITDAVKDYSLEDQFLTLEVTESVAIDNLDETINKFIQLKQEGVRLSLDDFGTGYSSLSHLKRLPIDELKIDKSFVHDIEEDPQDALLVKTIIAIAQQFNLSVVAEGVETIAQVEFLRQQKCDVYQGYYFSKPVALDELETYIKNM